MASVGWGGGGREKAGFSVGRISLREWSPSAPNALFPDLMYIQGLQLLCIGTCPVSWGITRGVGALGYGECRIGPL